MSYTSPVLWSEGLFVLPQHFQQQDRFFQHQTLLRQRWLHPHAWGWTQLELDQAALKRGHVALIKAQGFLNDGTAFDAPAEQASPLSLEVPAGSGQDTVHLVVPRLHWAAPQVQRPGQGDESAHASWLLNHVEAPNVHETQGEVEPVEVGMLNLQLRLGSQGLDGFAHVQVASIERCTDNQEVVLSNRYIPPVVHWTCSTSLQAMLSQVQSLLLQKMRLVHARRLGKTAQSAELADFMLLQTVLRHLPMIEHVVQQPQMHPMEVYAHVLQLWGDVQLFGEVAFAGLQSPSADLRYEHTDLWGSFNRLLQGLILVLQGLSEQRATRIDLVERQFGVRLGTVGNKKLFEDCYFVLTVYAKAPLETLLREFPTTVKIGPVDRIREVVNLNLPAVGLRHLPHAPREMPFYAEHVYFKLETQNQPLWNQVAEQGLLALHYAGPLPGLQLELWAVRKEESAA